MYTEEVPRILYEYSADFAMGKFLLNIYFINLTKWTISNSYLYVDFQILRFPLDKLNISLLFSFVSYGLLTLTAEIFVELPSQPAAVQPTVDKGARGICQDPIFMISQLLVTTFL